MGKSGRRPQQNAADGRRGADRRADAHAEGSGGGRRPADAVQAHLSGVSAAPRGQGHGAGRLLRPAPYPHRAHAVLRRSGCGHPAAQSLRPLHRHGQRLRGRQGRRPPPRPLQRRGRVGQGAGGIVAVRGNHIL